MFVNKILFPSREKFRGLESPVGKIGFPVVHLVRVINVVVRHFVLQINHLNGMKKFTKCLIK